MYFKSYLNGEEEFLKEFIINPTELFKNQTQKFLEVISVACLYCLNHPLKVKTDLRHTFFHENPKFPEDFPNHLKKETTGPPEDRRPVREGLSGTIELEDLPYDEKVTFDVYTLFMEGAKFGIGGSPFIYTHGRDYYKDLWNFLFNNGEVLPMGFYYFVKELKPLGKAQNYYKLAADGSSYFFEFIDTFSHEYAHLYKEMHRMSLIRDSPKPKESFKKIYLSNNEGPLADMYEEAFANIAGLECMLYFIATLKHNIDDDFTLDVGGRELKWAQIKDVKIGQFKDQILEYGTSKTAWRYAGTAYLLDWMKEQGEDFFDKSIDEIKTKHIDKWEFASMAYRWPGSVAVAEELQSKENNKESWDWIKESLLGDISRNK